MKQLEREESPSRATHPDEAHIFFLPFSVPAYHQKIKRTTAGIGYNGLPWITQALWHISIPTGIEAMVLTISCLHVMIGYVLLLECFVIFLVLVLYVQIQLKTKFKHIITKSNRGYRSELIKCTNQLSNIVDYWIVPNIYVVYVLPHCGPHLIITFVIRS